MKGEGVSTPAMKGGGGPWGGGAKKAQAFGAKKAKNEETSQRQAKQRQPTSRKTKHVGVEAENEWLVYKPKITREETCGS